jgi:hypothetical protein
MTHKKAVVSRYFIPRQSMTLRDSPELSISTDGKPIQIRYFNDVMVLFIKSLAKFYSQDALTEDDKANMRRYLNKMIEAKESMAGVMKP